MSTPTPKTCKPCVSKSTMLNKIAKTTTYKPKVNNVQKNP